MTPSGIPTAKSAGPRLYCAAATQTVVRLVGKVLIGTATHSKRERFWRIGTPRLMTGGLANASRREPQRRRRQLHPPLPPRLHPYERRTIKRLLFAVIITLSLVSGTITAEAEGLWAAIVYEQLEDTGCGGRNLGKLGAYGIAWNYETELAARLAAKEACEKHVSFCHHRYGFATQERCVVLAVDYPDVCRMKRVPHYARGIGDTARAAEEWACSEAKKRGHDCEVLFNTCKQ